MSASWESNFTCSCGAPLTILIMKGAKDLVTVGVCPTGHKKKFILSIGAVDQWTPSNITFLREHFFRCEKCNIPISTQPYYRDPYVKLQITCPVHGKNEIRLLPLSVYNIIVEKKSGVAEPSPPAQAAPTPSSSIPKCQYCGALTTLIPQYSRYYCYKCQRYVEDQKVVGKVRDMPAATLAAPPVKTELDALKAGILAFAQQSTKNIPYAVCDLPAKLNAPNIDSFQLEALLQEMITKEELAGQIDPATGDIIFLSPKLGSTPIGSAVPSAAAGKQHCIKCGSETEFIEAQNAYFCRQCFEYVKPLAPTPATPAVQERVEALRDFDYVGGQVRFKIAIANKTQYVITAVRVDLEIPKEFKLIRILPEASLDDLSRGLAKIDKLMPGASQGIDYYLEPVTCGVGVIAGFVKFQDAQGNFKSIDLKPREVAIKCPLVFKPEEANIAMIRNLMESLTKDYRRWALPATPPDSFKLLHETIMLFDITHIQAFQISGNPYEVESFYYTRAKTTNHPIAIKVNVSEQQNTLDLMIACENMAELTGLLSKIAEDFQSKALTKLQTSLKPAFSPLKELHCDCGNSLPKLPSRSEDVVCSSCAKAYTWEMLGF
ncbi:MAG: hypothetical protein LUQ65_11910 [Candidatus Helarchaeota archaeon]|nr:hypothetical protein [Candidatus Helarchaeota archaeon]